MLEPSLLSVTHLENGLVLTVAPVTTQAVTEAPSFEDFPPASRTFHMSLSRKM
jgi:hypothetical protein